MSDTKQDADLVAVRARADKASPGPWSREKPPYKDGWPLGSVIGGTVGRQTIYTHATGGTFPANDAAFIAHAREDIPALLDALERLMAENERLRGEYDDLRAESPKGRPVGEINRELVAELRDLAKSFREKAAVENPHGNNADAEICEDAADALERLSTAAESGVTPDIEVIHDAAVEFVNGRINPILRSDVFAAFHAGAMAYRRALAPLLARLEALEKMEQRAKEVEGGVHAEASSRFIGRYILNGSDAEKGKT